MAKLCVLVQPSVFYSPLIGILVIAWLEKNPCMEYGYYLMPMKQLHSLLLQAFYQEK